MKRRKASHRAGECHQRPLHTNARGWPSRARASRSATPTPSAKWLRRLGRRRPRRRRVRAGHDGRRPDRDARARRMLDGSIELLEAPLDEFWMRDIGPDLRRRRRAPRRARRRRLDLQRLGRARVGEWEQSAKIARVVAEARRRRARQLAPRERGRRNPRRRRGHGAAHRDRAARPAPQPVRRPGPRRGRAAAHDRRDARDLAAARPHPRLRRLRHERPRRHRRDDRVAGPRAAARAAQPRAPRPRR